MPKCTSETRGSCRLNTLFEFVVFLKKGRPDSQDSYAGGRFAALTNGRARRLEQRSIQAEDYDALVNPGGRAPEYLRLNQGHMPRGADPHSLASRKVDGSALIPLVGRRWSWPAVSMSFFRSSEQ